MRRGRRRRRSSRRPQLQDCPSTRSKSSACRKIKQWSVEFDKEKADEEEEYVKVEEEKDDGEDE